MNIRALIVCAAGLGIMVLCAVASPAFASDYAVGSDAKSITVNKAVHPGQTVNLPAFGIYNEGTKPADYQMNVVSIGARGGISPAWVTFTPKEFSLAPGGMSKIEAAISLPDDAPPGTYKALLAARLVNRGQGSVTMSVGIGPMVTVQIASGWWLSAAWYRLEGFFHDRAPWSYFGVVVAALAVLAGVIALVDRRRRRRAMRPRMDRAGLGPRGAVPPQSGALGGSPQGQS